MKNIVVITFPKHYHICQAAIFLLQKQFQPDKITIMFDDIFGLETEDKWDDLGNDLINDLKSNHFLKNCQITAFPFSTIKNVQLESNGWIRQQYVKLNLHKVLPEDQWLVVDGDTLIGHSIDPWKYCYINTGDKLHLHHDFFVRYLLNLDNNRVFFNSTPVEFSSIPIRLLSKKTLESIENLVQTLHGKDIQSVRNSFTLQEKSKYLEISEFDIICNYQYLISRDLLPMKDLPTYFTPAEKIYTEWETFKNRITVLEGDDNIPFDWYEQFGVKKNQKIWERLYL